MAYGVHGYKRTSIQTADRRHLIVLLYEGAVSRLNQAVECIQKEEREEQARLINRVLEIIKLLDNALDYRQGGEIARRLNALYTYMRDTLALANIENDADRVLEVAGLLNTLLEGWRGILDQPINGAGAPAPEPPAGPEAPQPTVVSLNAPPPPLLPRSKGNGAGYPNYGRKPGRFSNARPPVMA
ncbi:MAG: flagellar export chaperone FliS [Candidatus Sumerlaeota bacterium]|nr:flagellar export chaperone FliS [Candidatus Sumerlaeota bacterium]